MRKKITRGLGRRTGFGYVEDLRSGKAHCSERLLGTQGEEGVQIGDRGWHLRGLGDGELANILGRKGWYQIGS